MKDKSILIICGILLFVILFWNIIEEEYKFNERTEYFIETNTFSEGYQKIGELYIIDEWAWWDTSKEWAWWDTSKNCKDIIYNEGKGVDYVDMTYEQEFCLRAFSEELTKKVSEVGE